MPALAAIFGLVTAIVPTLSSSCSTWFETTRHGTAFRNVKDFGAQGDGISDDTRAIQAAIDHNRYATEDGGGAPLPAIVYLPPGRYMVSDTLVCWFYTNLVGSSSTEPGCGSTIELMPNATGFSQQQGSAPLIKPVIVFASGFNTKIGAHAWWSGPKSKRGPWCLNNSVSDRCGDSFNMNFYAHIRLVNIVIGKGNPSASALMWNVAQQTSIRNVSIDLSQSGAVGLDVSGDNDVAAYRR